VTEAVNKPADAARQTGTSEVLASSPPSASPRSAHPDPISRTVIPLFGSDDVILRISDNDRHWVEQLVTPNGRRSPWDWSPVFSDIRAASEWLIEVQSGPWPEPTTTPDERPAKAHQTTG
jgi:hypothetical protein